MTKLLIITLISTISVFSQTLDYPFAKKGSQVDNYFGTKVPDPYRWMEDDSSTETAQWDSAENKLSEQYFSKIPYRSKLRQRLTSLWNYEKFSSPFKEGDNIYFFKNNGLQEQNVLYFQNGLTGTPEVFLDPNTFSKDGSVYLENISFSKDHKHCVYAISNGGSDWRELFVMDVASKKTLQDHIKWAKFTDLAWYKDGFFYSRYDEPQKGKELKMSVQNHKIYYHRLGTNQSEDRLIFADPEHPNRILGENVSQDERFLVVPVYRGTSKNMLYFADLKNGMEVKPLIDSLNADYFFINNLGNKLLVLTNRQSPNYRVVLIDPAKPTEKNWQTLIPEQDYVMTKVKNAGGKLIVSFLKDATSLISVYDLSGKFLYNIHLPGKGTVKGLNGKNDQYEIFYSYSSFTTPPLSYAYNIAQNKGTLFKKSNLNFNIDDFETKQVFYPSKDDTKIPMFIVYKKGIDLNANNPALLYGYGGFQISITPTFHLEIIPLLESGFIYCVANLRGGNEYGEAWHKAGMLSLKQNVFDDFIYAAKYLIKEGYTSSQKLGIYGRSNGGLLIGACMTQEPSLYKVALPAVGVLDMLRFQKFTIGHAWVVEYGSSDDPEQFKYLYKYSPLQNIKKGVKYPATLITTADHDDRVFPAHSFKFAATLQEKQAGDAPVLIRVETNAGHSSISTTSKQIDFYTDLWSFLMYNIGVDYK